MPIFRDFILSVGFGEANRKTLEYILTNKGKCAQKGQAPVLVIGGVAEMRQADPNHIKLILKNRLGFIKTALQTGASLVPVFSFGELDIYDQSFFQCTNQFDILFKIDRVIKTNCLKIKFWLTFLRELGYFFKLLFLFAIKKAKRVNIYTVVGKPINCNNSQPIENPTDDQIKSLHELYMTELTSLFHEHKGKYLLNKNATFEII